MKYIYIFLSCLLIINVYSLKKKDIIEKNYNQLDKQYYEAEEVKPISNNRNYFKNMSNNENKNSDVVIYEQPASTEYYPLLPDNFYSPQIIDNILNNDKWYSSFETHDNHIFNNNNVKSFKENNTYKNLTSQNFNENDNQQNNSSINIIYKKTSVKNKSNYDVKPKELEDYEELKPYNNYENLMIVPLPHNILDKNKSKDKSDENIYVDNKNNIKEINALEDKEANKKNKYTSKNKVEEVKIKDEEVKIRDEVKDKDKEEKIVKEENKAEKHNNNYVDVDNELDNSNNNINKSKEKSSENGEKDKEEVTEKKVKKSTKTEEIKEDESNKYKKETEIENEVINEDTHDKITKENKNINSEIYKDKEVSKELVPTKEETNIEHKTEDKTTRKAEKNQDNDKNNTTVLDKSIVQKDKNMMTNLNNGKIIKKVNNINEIANNRKNLYNDQNKTIKKNKFGIKNKSKSKVNNVFNEEEIEEDIKMTDNHSISVDKLNSKPNIRKVRSKDN